MTITAQRVDVAVERLDVSVFTVPTDFPESDGTAKWDATTMVLVEAHAGDRTGLGYTYGDPAAGALIRGTLAPLVEGRDALAVTRTTELLRRACRNLGRPGLGAMAISAVDTALWDLKARLLDLPLATLLDAVHDAVPVYGSGGFTSYTDDQLADQLAGWVDDGIPRVKMKIGREPGRDPDRVATARAAIGDDAELYVDANGALDRKQALALAYELVERFAVTWFEEPVTSEDLEGLRLLRDRAPAGVDIAAGEYGDTLASFERLLDAGAVDCLQADVTRCEGITGFLRVAALCEARSLPLSAHCGPAIHLHPCCAAVPLRHLEYFHDHVRVEHIVFDGVPEPVGGALRPDLSRPGNGLELKRSDAEQYADD
ncbi:MAG TPA: enolase C-terminal domain-like protein [Gaiellaceae bacterium]|nr:enolase C-terminal domain-like protein [Gaiellaceae bacterium]